MRGLRTGELLWDLYYFAKYLTRPTVDSTDGIYDYYARDRWPHHDFEAGARAAVSYQVEGEEAAAAVVTTADATTASPAPP